MTDHGWGAIYLIEGILEFFGLVCSQHDHISADVMHTHVIDEESHLKEPLNAIHAAHAHTHTH